MLSRSILNFLNINSKKKIKLNNQIWFSSKNNLNQTHCVFLKN